MIACQIGIANIRKCPFLAFLPLEFSKAKQALVISQHMRLGALICRSASAHRCGAFYFNFKSVISTFSALPIQRILLHLIKTRPRLPVFFPSINSSVSLRRTFIYESMLSSLPLYSVWPHLSRMTSSVPTLACKNGRGLTGWRVIVACGFQKLKWSVVHNRIWLQSFSGWHETVNYQ